jgi:hypothetical protein
MIEESGAGLGAVSLTNEFGSREAQKHIDPTDPDPHHCMLKKNLIL